MNMVRYDNGMVRTLDHLLSPHEVQIVVLTDMEVKIINHRCYFGNKEEMLVLVIKRIKLVSEQLNCTAKVKGQVCRISGDCDPPFTPPFPSVF